MNAIAVVHGHGNISKVYIILVMFCVCLPLDLIMFCRHSSEKSALMAKLFRDVEVSGQKKVLAVALLHYTKYSPGPLARETTEEHRIFTS